MIDVLDHAEGCILLVRVQPGAKRAQIVGEHGGALKVAIMAPAREGRANEALIELLHEHLGLRRSALFLIAGAAARDKKLLVRGVSREELMQKLAIVLHAET